MAAIRVVLVESKFEGNVGFVARAMANFGLTDLVLVKPPKIGEEARRRAMHGLDILESAKIVGSLALAVKDCGLVAGTTGVDAKNEKRFTRLAISPREFAERARSYSGRIALVFGREDYGLFDKEIEDFDILVTIPASPKYPVLNLSHAAAILFYEVQPGPTRRVSLATGFEREKLHSTFADLLRSTEYPPHKFDRTRVMFRRMVGRAMPTKWEFHALMGVYARAVKRIQRLEAKK